LNCSHCLFDPGRGCYHSFCQELALLNFEVHRQPPAQRIARSNELHARGRNKSRQSESLLERARTGEASGHTPVNPGRRPAREHLSGIAGRARLRGVGEEFELRRPRIRTLRRARLSARTFGRLCWTDRGAFAKFKFGWELRELEGVPLRCVTIVSTTSNPVRPTSVISLSPATSTRVPEDLLHRMTVQQPSAFFPEQSLPSLRT
jgi:hypothetical protein